jgi:hypothetical protein
MQDNYCLLINKSLFRTCIYMTSSCAALLAMHTVVVQKSDRFPPDQDQLAEHECICFCCIVVNFASLTDRH